MRRFHVLIALLFLAAPILARATVFASLHGVVHDPQHRPIAGAQVSLKDSDSAFDLQAISSAVGEFEFAQVPIGVYRLEVSAPGFAGVSQSITIASGTNPVVHIPLAVGQPLSRSLSRPTPPPLRPLTRLLPPPSSRDR